jgi:aromatic-L-amino-acid/L-tryptophan decarboxylase
LNDWQQGTGDMPPEEFRRYGRQVVDWIADYFSQVEEYPVLSRVKPGDVARSLPAGPPDAPESIDQLLQDFDRLILPGITHWNHPGFLAYFAITGSAPGVLAEFLSAALNVNAMLWRTSPAATELETVALDWLRQLVGLPEAFEGVVYDTASISSLVAIAAAREATGLRFREKGMAGRADTPRLRLYCSEHAHSSIEKDAITLGIGQEGVRKIAVDSQYRMNVSALRSSLEEDLANGWLPFCVVATVGTTSTTSIDPVPPIAELCAENRMWLHVDAAYGGVAAIVPEMRWVLDGVDQADSVVINPHKWLFTPVDCSTLYSRRLDAVQAAFSLVPAYLQTPESGAVRDYMNYGPQLGRRFRALKLWFVMRAFGREGLIARLRRHIELAREVARWIEEDPEWEILAPAPFSTVCFRAHPSGLEARELDGLNIQIEDAVNRSGEIFLSHTELHGEVSLRLSIGNLHTEERHLRRAWQLMQEALAAFRSGPMHPTHRRAPQSEPESGPQ